MTASMKDNCFVSLPVVVTPELCRLHESDHPPDQIMAGLHKIHNYDPNKHFKYCFSRLDDCLFAVPWQATEYIYSPGSTQPRCMRSAGSSTVDFSFAYLYKFLCWKFVLGLLLRTQENDSYRHATLCRRTLSVRRMHGLTPAARMHMCL